MKEFFRRRRSGTPLQPSRKEEGNLVEAARQGDLELVQRLMQDWNDPRVTQAMMGDAVLAAAASTAHTWNRTLHELLETIRVNPNRKDSEGYTALINAAKRGDRRIVRQLLSCDRVNPNLQDTYGKTALMWAAQKAHREIIRDLLDSKQIRPNITNLCGDIGYKIVGPSIEYRGKMFNRGDKVEYKRKKLDN